MPAARVHFQERLDRIRADVIRMGHDAQGMVRDALSAAVNHDVSLAERVVFSDDAIDSLERRVANEAMLAVLMEAPVAGDLRFLMASMGVAAELEKVCDDAVKLARRTRKIPSGLPAELKVPMQELGEAALEQLFHALRLYTAYDAQEAEKLIQGDTRVDRLFKQARKKVTEIIRERPDDTERLLRCTMCFHALEHVADHAAAIGVRMRMVHELGQDHIGEEA